MSVDKSKLRCPITRNFLTQGLFIEHQYNTERAVYSWGEEDKEYKGKTYPSLKRLYLEMEDVGEYEFATTHLCGWKHWMRLCDNESVLLPHIEEWRMELEIKLRGRAIKNIINDANAGKPSSPSSNKYLADKGWSKKVGRPTKAEQEREAEVRSRIKQDKDDYKSDIVRLQDHMKD